jgi:hypothetical protein
VCVCVCVYKKIQMSTEEINKKKQDIIKLISSQISLLEYLTADESKNSSNDQKRVINSTRANAVNKNFSDYLNNATISTVEDLNSLVIKKLLIEPPSNILPATTTTADYRYIYEITNIEPKDVKFIPYKVGNTNTTYYFKLSDNKYTSDLFQSQTNSTSGNPIDKLHIGSRGIGFQSLITENLMTFISVFYDVPHITMCIDKHTFTFGQQGKFLKLVIINSNSVRHCLKEIGLYYHATQTCSKYVDPFSTHIHIPYLTDKSEDTQVISGCLLEMTYYKHDLSSYFYKKAEQLSSISNTTSIIDQRNSMYTTLVNRIYELHIIFNEQSGILHGDLSYTNIYITETLNGDYELKITDFDRAYYVPGCNRFVLDNSHYCTFTSNDPNWNLYFYTHIRIAFFNNIQVKYDDYMNILYKDSNGHDSRFKTMLDEMKRTEGNLKKFAYGTDLYTQATEKFKQSKESLFNFVSKTMTKTDRLNFVQRRLLEYINRLQYTISQYSNPTVLQNIRNYTDACFYLDAEDIIKYHDLLL